MGQPPGGSWNISQGPLTRNARDGALALEAISGPDGAEIISLQSDPPDYLREIGAGVEGLRMAWTDDFGFTAKYAVENRQTSSQLSEEPLLTLKPWAQSWNRRTSASQSGLRCWPWASPAIRQPLVQPSSVGKMRASCGGGDFRRF